MCRTRNFGSWPWSRKSWWQKPRPPASPPLCTIGVLYFEQASLNPYFCRHSLLQNHLHLYMLCVFPDYICFVHLDGGYYTAPSNWYIAIIFSSGFIQLNGRCSVRAWNKYDVMSDHGSPYIKGVCIQVFDEKRIIYTLMYTDIHVYLVSENAKTTLKSLTIPKG
jgi:hypothetical protein